MWVQYKRRPTDEFRNLLVENYLPLVRYHAERVAAKLPGMIDINDLMSAGIFGLMDAISKFDLERGIKFETYCATRIRGSIIDELRAMDWVPRLTRSRSSTLDAASRSLENELGRVPTDAEIAKRLKIGLEQFEKTYAKANIVETVSLSRKWFETDSNRDVREIDVLEDTAMPNPFDNSRLKDLKEFIARGLSRAERLIIILYYFEEMTMKEIGATLDLSESRVSQVHSSILARLRARAQSDPEALN
jgi:RNA polymerase sigma factor for flagellar operon FliA